MKTMGILRAVSICSFVLLAGYATDASAQFTKKNVTFECMEPLESAELRGYFDYGKYEFDFQTMKFKFTITSTDPNPVLATPSKLMGMYQSKHTVAYKATSTTNIWVRCRFQKKINGVWTDLGAPLSPTQAVVTSPADTN